MDLDPSIPMHMGHIFSMMYKQYNKVAGAYFIIYIQVGQLIRWT